jgi:hypothetical protein
VAIAVTSKSADIRSTVIGNRPSAGLLCSTRPGGGSLLRASGIRELGKSSGLRSLGGELALHRVLSGGVLSGGVLSGGVLSGGALDGGVLDGGEDGGPSMRRSSGALKGSARRSMGSKAGSVPELDDASGGSLCRRPAGLSTTVSSL